MMNASENLNAARILVEERPENGNVHASSIMQLCRSAMDSSARTIWLLSDPDSEVRRDRCLSLLMEQLEQQRRFLKINDDNVNRGPNPPPADCGRSSVRESRLTRGPLLRTGRASAATGSMCEVTGCATSDWFERASIWPHRHQLSNGVFLDGRRSSVVFGRSCSRPRSSSRPHRPRSRPRSVLL